MIIHGETYGRGGWWPSDKEIRHVEGRCAAGWGTVGMTSWEIWAIMGLLVLNLAAAVILNRIMAVWIAHHLEELAQEIAEVLQSTAAQAIEITGEGVSPIQVAIAQLIASRAQTIDAKVTPAKGSDGRFKKLAE